MLTLTQKPGSPVPIGKAISKFVAYLTRPKLSVRDHQRYEDWFVNGRRKGEPKPKLRKRSPMKGTKRFWVKEPHLGGGENHGNLHVHMLIDVFIPKGILDNAWRHATEGYGEFTFAKGSEHQDIVFAAAYASKYVGKTFGEYYTGFSKGERRYQFSRHDDFKLPKWIPPYPVKFILNRDAKYHGLRNLELVKAMELWKRVREIRRGGGDPWETLGNSLGLEV